MLKCTALVKDERHWQAGTVSGDLFGRISDCWE